MSQKINCQPQSPPQRSRKVSPDIFRMTASNSLGLIVTSNDELAPSQSIWGTGGWMPPEHREALDWLTLSRFLGWDVTIARRDLKFDIESSRIDRIVIAGDADCLGDNNIGRLA